MIVDDEGASEINFEALGSDQIPAIEETTFLARMHYLLIIIKKHDF